MSELVYQPISRQQFLKVSAGLLGGWLVSWETPTTSAESAGPSSGDCPLRLALISDTHVAADPAENYRGFKPFENLQQVVRQVLIAQPQAVIVNGDAARLEGHAADYQQLQHLLEPLAARAPIGIALGNHDDRANFRTVFDTQPDGFQRQADVDKHVLVMEHPLLRAIVLDSLLYVNQVAGLLGKVQRQWLDRYLAGADQRPTVLLVHHTLGESDGELLDADRMFQIVERHANVKAIFYGHSHRYQVERRGRLHLVNLPACGYNFDDSQPVGWMDANFTSDGCGLTLRAIGGNIADDGKTVTLAWNP
jgi:3',5'-cyclic AMP phosphodiesterase CpdA